MRRILIAENSSGVTVTLWRNEGRHVEGTEYDFDTWDEALEALPNLPEVE